MTLTRATIPMCPKCGVEASGRRVVNSKVEKCKPDEAEWFVCTESLNPFHGRIHWGYHDESDRLRDIMREVAERLRRLAGDGEWEHEDGTPADLRGWADELDPLNKES